MILVSKIAGIQDLASKSVRYNSRGPVWKSPNLFSSLGSKMAPRVRVLAPVSAQRSQNLQKINEKIQTSMPFKGQGSRILL